jgi:hypothetical protein
VLGSGPAVGVEPAAAGGAGEAPLPFGCCGVLFWPKGLLLPDAAGCEGWPKALVAGWVGWPKAGFGVLFADAPELKGFGLATGWEG